MSNQPGSFIWVRSPSKVYDQAQVQIWVNSGSPFVDIPTGPGWTRLTQVEVELLLTALLHLHLSLWFTTAWGNADSVCVNDQPCLTHHTCHFKTSPPHPPPPTPIWSPSTPLLPVPVPNTLGANLSSAQNNNLCKSFPSLPLPRHPLPFLHTYHPSVDLKNLPHWQPLLSQEKRGVVRGGGTNVIAEKQ